ILTKDLLVKTDDVTRSSVQKAVIVLATQPIFGVLRQRLAVVTAAWFGQRDFTQTEILGQFYESLSATVSDNIPDSAFMMGTSLRELVKKFKYKVLVLLKLLLLEKRVIFFGYPVETLCTYQYSLISLVPGLLKSLQDTGSPLLDSQELYLQSMSKTPTQSTDKQTLFTYLGLPLHIFGEGSFFQPYLPLQQIDILQHARTRSYIIGTTNSIFLHNRDCATDVIVNTGPGTIEILQDSLSSVLSLTSADRRWVDEIIEAVNLSGNDDAQTEYIGGDDYLRAKFEEYILTLLSSVKHAQFTQADDPMDGIGGAGERDLTLDYGSSFVKAWQQTPNFQLWNDFVDWELLNEIVAPGHPCQGNFSLAHVQRRLANQFKDMRIDKNLAPLKQSFSRAVTTSRERLSNVFDTVWQEFEKLQPEDTNDTSSLDSSLYKTATGDSPDRPGLVQSTSIKPVERGATRSDLSPGDDHDDDDLDSVSPPPLPDRERQSFSYPRAQSSASNAGSWSNSVSSSPVSAISSTLGPATAATAALGQKAVGMFANVSSFFQSKRRDFLEAQREAEEQHQQRIMQHERKQRAMQQRARATASTFALSPRLNVSPDPTKQRQRPASAGNSGTTGESLDAAPTRRGVSLSSTPLPNALDISEAMLESCLEPEEEIEKELQEAIDTTGSVQTQSREEPQESLAHHRGPAGLAITTPARSLTPAECYSPFSEISAPSTPVPPEEEGVAGSSKKG
ncbi:late secretory pathway protein avl9, partial [Lunasporangiospora selenospora]